MRQRIGLASEPLTAGRRLLPPAGERAGSGHALLGASRHASTSTSRTQDAIRRPRHRPPRPPRRRPRRTAPSSHAIRRRRRPKPPSNPSRSCAALDRTAAATPARTGTTDGPGRRAHRDSRTCPAERAANLCQLLTPAWGAACRRQATVKAPDTGVPMRRMEMMTAGGVTLAGLGALVGLAIGSGDGGPKLACAAHAARRGAHRDHPQDGQRLPA